MGRTQAARLNSTSALPSAWAHPYPGYKACPPPARPQPAHAHLVTELDRLLQQRLGLLNRLPGRLHGLEHSVHPLGVHLAGQLGAQVDQVVQCHACG